LFKAELCSFAPVRTCILSAVQHIVWARLSLDGKQYPSCSAYPVISKCTVVSRLFVCCAGTTADTSTEKMGLKADIPGTQEHKVKKEEKNLQKDEKNMQKDEKKLHKQEAKQDAKNEKNLQKEETKLHKQENRAADAAEKTNRI